MQEERRGERENTRASVAFKYNFPTFKAKSKNEEKKFHPLVYLSTAQKSCMKTLSLAFEIDFKINASVPLCARFCINALGKSFNAAGRLEVLSLSLPTLGSFH